MYKLQELDDRFALLRSGMHVLDLGAAPGSWSQYASERVGPKGTVIAVDSKAIEPISGVTALQADITETDAVIESLRGRSFDVILADLAPNTSGTHDVDQWRSLQLNHSALAIAAKLLTPGGTCVLKVLRGADFDEFLRELKAHWKNVHAMKTHVSRDRSNEIYLVLR